MSARTKKKDSAHDDAMAAAKFALVAAGVEQVEIRPLRKGWLGYDSETPRRYIILDRWREHAIWEKKCRGVVLRMNIMRQYIQMATSFSVPPPLPPSCLALLPPPLLRGVI